MSTSVAVSKLPLPKRTKSLPKNTPMGWQRAIFPFASRSGATTEFSDSHQGVEPELLRSREFQSAAVVLGPKGGDIPRQVG